MELPYVSSRDAVGRIRAVVGGSGGAALNTEKNEKHINIIWNLTAFCKLGMGTNTVNVRSLVAHSTIVLFLLIGRERSVRLLWLKNLVWLVHSHTVIACSTVWKIGMWLDARNLELDRVHLLEPGHTPSSAGRITDLLYKSLGLGELLTVVHFRFINHYRRPESETGLIRMSYGSGWRGRLNSL